MLLPRKVNCHPGLSQQKHITNSPNITKIKSSLTKVYKFLSSSISNSYLTTTKNQTNQWVRASLSFYLTITNHNQVTLDFPPVIEVSFPLPQALDFHQDCFHMILLRPDEQYGYCFGHRMVPWHFGSWSDCVCTSLSFMMKVNGVQVSYGIIVVTVDVQFWDQHTKNGSRRVISFYDGSYRWVLVDQGLWCLGTFRETLNSSSRLPSWKVFCAAVQTGFQLWEKTVSCFRC